MALTRVRPFLYQLRDGSETDPYVDKTETVTPIDGRAVIEEIPVKGFGVLIDGYVEKTSNTPAGTEFYVDYSNGVIYLDKSVTTAVNIRYRGRGVVKVPAERIFFGDSETGVTMDVTLKEMHELLSTSENATVELQEKIDEVILATSNANVATLNAQAMADLAETKAGEANVSAQNANSAAQLATQEASGLSQMKSDVITATSNANVATSEANAKALLAGEKANLADIAALNANTSATNAQEKANLADEKALYAEGEGNIARARGEFADSMALEAETQGLYAKTQGDYAMAEALNLNGLKDAVSTATTAANSAADYANTSAASADTSATNADVKSSLAQTKIDAMNVLSSEVEVLKGTLTTKITESNMATSESIAATTNANTAAGFANEKGLLAQTETSNLTQLKIDVTEATLLANGSASDAQIKANLAEQKGVFAQQQGDYAKSQGDAIQDILDNGSVASVNGRTGAVVLTAADVGTITTSEIDTRIQTEIDGLIGAAPDALDTLNELSTALGNDPNFATTVTNDLATKATKSELGSHTADTTIHVTPSEKSGWNAKLDSSDVGVPGGVAELGLDGKVLPAQLPQIASSWNDLQDKPTQFNPSTHGHDVADITGLQQALDNAAKMEKYETVVTATQGQVLIQIPWVTFDAVNDYLSIHINRTILTTEDYLLTGRNISLNEGLNEGDSVHIVVLKAVVRGVDEPISAANLADGSITNEKLSQSVKIGNLNDLMTDHDETVVGAINESVQNFYENYWSIGELINLQTATKGTVVGAVNEVNSLASEAKTKADSADTKATNAANQIGLLSGLNTTAKTNLVASINELFTFANDGKTKWSSVIGSPLVSSDTFTQMQSKTQTIKNTLATNLTAKGQSSVGTETMTALVNKVANVATGKKYATGNKYTDSNAQLSVTTLDFTPSIVEFEHTVPSTGEYLKGHLSGVRKTLGTNTIYGVSVTFTTGSSRTSSDYGGTLHPNDNGMLTNGFKLRFDSFRMNSAYITWRAWE